MQSHDDHPPPFKGVLLGVAELRLTLKQLTKKELQRVAYICYQKLLEIEVEDVTPEEKNLKCFGVVDSFYALQEVTISVAGDICQLSNRNEVILELELGHLVIAMPVNNCLDRVIIISRTQNFGRTAVILQMHSEQVVKQMLKMYLQNQNVQSCEVGEEQSSAFRRSAGSFGKAKLKMTNIFSVLGGQGSDKRQTGISPSPSTPSSLSGADDGEDVSDTEEVTNERECLLSSLVFLEPKPKLNVEKVSMTPLQAEIRYFKNSEESFVHILQYVEDVKAALFATSDLDIKLDSVLELFLHIDNLLHLHKEFLKCLNEMSENLVKEVVLIFANFSSRFEFYSDYIGHALAVDYLFNLHSDFFRAFYPQLGEYLRKPRMRLNHYVLVLESLKRNSNVPEKDLVQKEIEKLKVILRNGNSRLIVASIHDCHFNLYDHGNVITHGELFLLKGDNLPKRKYQAFLFEDLLTISKGTADSSEFVACFRIRKMEILFFQRGVLIHLKAVVKDKTLKVTFKAKSVNQQQMWLQALQTQIDIVNFFDRPSPPEVDSQIGCDKLGSPRIDLLEKITPNKGLPPLTIKNFLLNLPFSSSFAQSTDWVLRQLYESEKTLVKILRNLLCRHVQDSGSNTTRSMVGLHGELSEMYHLHNEYLLPVIATSNQKVKINYICQRIIEKMEDFQTLYEKVLFMASVFSYEFEVSELHEVLKCVADNFEVYRKTFQNILDTTKVEICKNMINTFNEIESKVCISLKRKYIRKFPAELTEPILHEGILSRMCGFSEHEIYLILSETQLHFIAVVSNYYVYEQSIAVQHLKCSSIGTNSFEIKFISSRIDKVKYKFSTSSEEDKNKWLNSFKDFPLHQRKKVRFPAMSRSRFKSEASSNILLTLSAPISISNSFTSADASNDTSNCPLSAL